MLLLVYLACQKSLNTAVLMSNTISYKLRNDRTMSQSTEHGAGWYVDGLMGALLAVLHPDGGAYYYFFIIHDTFFY